MNLYDDPVMDDLLIRGEQARRKRSHKKRRLKPDEVIDNTNLRLEAQFQPQQVWFEFRFHLPLFNDFDSLPMDLTSGEKIYTFQNFELISSIS